MMLLFIQRNCQLLDSSDPLKRLIFQALVAVQGGYFKLWSKTDLSIATYFMELRKQLT